MWTALNRTLKAPMRLVTLLSQIVTLLQEQNQILREIHVGVTGRPSLTPKQMPSDRPQRIRTGSDISPRTPLTQDRHDAAVVAEREESASVSRAATSNSEEPAPLARGPIRGSYGSTGTGPESGRDGTSR